MATQTTIIAQTELELIHELVMHAYEIKSSYFSPVGKGTVYDLPVRSKRNVSFNGDGYTREEGIVKGLDFSQQLLLVHQLSGRFGIPLSHNTLRKNFDVAHSPEGQRYKNNVLNRYWVFTGEMIEKYSNGYLAEGEQLIPKQVKVYRTGSVLQTQIPTKSGHFDDFKGVIPVDSEIGKGTKGYWNGVYFEDDLSAVRCGWNSDGQYLNADADRPLSRNDYGVLGIGTDAPLNK